MSKELPKERDVRKSYKPPKPCKHGKQALKRIDDDDSEDDRDEDNYMPKINPKLCRHKKHNSNWNEIQSSVSLSS